MRSRPTVRCHLCQPGPIEFPYEEIGEHLREAHGLDVRIDTWPDGTPIVPTQRTGTAEAADEAS